MADDEVVVGRIGRAHGIKGEVSVEPRTDEPARRFAPGSVLRTTGPRDLWSELTVTSSRTHQGRLLVRFEEISDRTTAESARGLVLAVPVDPDESPEDPEEFYDHQLVGLLVEDVDGTSYGELLRIEHHGAQDLLVVSTTRGEVLFPFVTALVPEVDVAGGRIVVDAPAGLFEL